MTIDDTLAEDTDATDATRPSRTSIGSGGTATPTAPRAARSALARDRRRAAARRRSGLRHRLVRDAGRLQLATSAASEGTAPSQREHARRPTTTAPPASTDPSAAALRNLGLRQSDVRPTVSVVADPARQQRHQRAHVGSLQRDVPERVGAQGSPAGRRASTRRATSALSTESVLYSNASATEQAFTELERRRPNCPSTPVASPVDEDTTTTKFNAVPDGSWPQVAGVDRRAFDFTTTGRHRSGATLGRGVPAPRAGADGHLLPATGLRADARRGTDDDRGDRQRLRRAHGRLARLRRELDIGRA